MSILRKNSTPGTAGQTIPGTPAVPPSPAYCQTETISHPSGVKPIFIEDPGNPATMRPPGILIIWVSTGPYTETVTTCYPATPGSPATPPTVIPATVANFYPGWNAAANSIGNLTGSGQYRFSGDPASVGVITGITSEPAGTTYSNITHGVYFSNGQYQYMENGNPMSAARSFVDADEFIIARDAAGRVMYLKNGVLELSSKTLSYGVVYADAALYFGNDEIDAAALEAFSVTAAYGTGTLDPPVPPGPTPPPGQEGQWNACNAFLQPFVVWASDTTPNGVQAGPGPQGPPDPLTGDWAGRTGGTLRMLAGKAEGNGYGNWNAGEVRGTLTPFTAEAFEGTSYCFVEGTLGGFEVKTGGDQLVPQYIICQGYLQPFAGFSTTLAGVNGSVTGTIGPLVVFGSDTDGGWVDTDGPPPIAVDDTGNWAGRTGGQLTQLVGLSFTLSAMATGGVFDETYVGRYDLFGLGYSPVIANDPVTGFPVGYGFFGLHGGQWTLAAYSGAYFDEQGPSGDVVGGGAAAILGRFDCVGPAGSIIMQGTVAIGGGFFGEHWGEWTLEAYGGGAFNVIGPSGVLGGSVGTGPAGGFAGSAGSFDAVGPHGVLDAAADASAGFGYFDELGPALEPVWGTLNSIGPHGILVAGGKPAQPVVDVATETEGYSVTLMEDGDGIKAAVSRYTQYPFERIVRFGSTYYGITPTGIYQIGGDLFDTAKIVANVAHPPHDFMGALGKSANRAQQKIKTMRAIMLTGHIPASVEVSVAVDDDGSSLNGYSYTPEPTDTARNHRVEVGRGLEGRYIAMSLTNPDGKDFTVEEASAEFDVSKQRDTWRR